MKMQNNIVKGYKNTITNFFENSKYNNSVNFEKKQDLNFILDSGHFENIEIYPSNFQIPSIIANAVITCSNENSLIKPIEFCKLLEKLENFSCKHIVLIYSVFFSVKKIKNHLDTLKNYNIHSVTIICDYNEEYYTDSFGEIVMSLQLNKNLIVLNSPFEKNFEDTMFFSLKSTTFSFVKSRNEFNSNITLFSESQKLNTYFNQKLYIGPSGEIKNAPETAEVFGYIQDIKSEEVLQEIISTPDFQKYWFVHKDLIDVCKECEFRHTCVDNRVPIKRAKDEWFHKIECNYNPYIAKWAGEDGHQTLEECGVISNESGFSIDHEKIKQINLKLETERS